MNLISLKIKPKIEILVLFLLDLFVILYIFSFAYLTRVIILPKFFDFFPKELPVVKLPYFCVIIFIWFFFIFQERLYSSPITFWDEIKSLWKVSIFSTITIFTFVSLTKSYAYFSRTVLVLMGFYGMIFFPIFRLTGKQNLRKLNLFKRKVLILGAGRTGRLIAKLLKKEKNYGYKIAGFLDDDPNKIGKYIEGIKVHSGVKNALNYIKSADIKDVFIAMPGAGKGKIQNLVNQLQYEVEKIFVIPDLFDISVLGTKLHTFFGINIFALEVQNNLEKPFNIFIKRTIDYLGAIIFLIILAIPMLIIALLIKLESKGPIIFSQERVGKGGKKFRCYKFRTMYEDAEERLKRLLAEDESARKEWETYYKLKNDPRVTKIGKFLRKTSLDELPQLFNVLKGEMSLVGPRPVTEEELKIYYKNYARYYLNVLPGITGLWQVSGRSEITYEMRVFLDVWYVRNWSLWLDIVILLKTIKAVLKSEGAC